MIGKWSVGEIGKEMTLGDKVELADVMTRSRVWESTDQLESSRNRLSLWFFFVGAFAYADDLVLLAPSANAMRHMLRLCDDDAAQFNVVFNASKSKCICCSPAGAAEQVTPADSLPSFSIGFRVIEFVDKWPHLGHIITKECTDTDDILNEKSSLIGQINKVLYNFRKVNCQTKTRLVKTYCPSFYGAELWDLSKSYIESICIAWRKGIRRVWQLPNTTHSVLIPVLSDTLPLLDLFFVRMLSFVHGCLRSESPLINFMVRHRILHGQNGLFYRHTMSHNAPFGITLVYTISSICTFNHVTSSVTLTQVYTARHLYLRCSNFCKAEMVLCVYRAVISIWWIYLRWLTLFVPVNYCTFFYAPLFVFLAKTLYVVFGCTNKMILYICSTWNNYFTRFVPKRIKPHRIPESLKLEIERQIDGLL